MIGEARYVGAYHLSVQGWRRLMKHPAQWIPVVLVSLFWLYALNALITGRMLAGRSLNSRVIDRRHSPGRFWLSWGVFVVCLAVFTHMLWGHLA